ncbi:hypothetical protein ACFPRL_16520 [Pseudoclavibacter helvolus]
MVRFSGPRGPPVVLERAYSLARRGVLPIGWHLGGRSDYAGEVVCAINCPDTRNNPPAADRLQPF